MNTEMNDPGTLGQYRQEQARERLRAPVAGPDDIAGIEVEPVTVHLTQAELDRAERIAWYRNFRADALKKKISPRWSRKNVMESFIRSGINAALEQIGQLEADYGPLPTTKEAVKVYAFEIVKAEREAAGLPESEE